MRTGQIVNQLLAPVGLKVSRLERFDAERQRQLYFARHGADAVAKKRFFNIGAGSFRHPFWSNVDMPSDWYAADQGGNIDIEWDIATLEPIKVETGVAEVVYTSHTIEHLQDSHDAHLFDEAYRILKPGGFIRVTGPDIQLYYEAYRRNDRDLMLYPATTFSPQDQFLNEFASQLSDMMRSGNPQGASSIKIPDQEVDRVFQTMPFDQACDHFTAMCDYDLHRKALGAHINWWTHEKVERFLSRAGFRDIRRSAYGQSFCPILRDTQYFDSTSPAYSFYVEAIK